MALLNPLCPAIETGVPLSARQIGFVKLASGRSLNIDYVKPAPGQPTVVLVNGLTYRIGCWDAFVRELHGNGLGILRYDPMGQGQTLLKYAKHIDAIPYQDQVEDLVQLLNALHLPQVHVAGLSYGGGIGFAFAAAHPDRLLTLTAMAPFVLPLPDQDQYLRSQVTATRIMFPYNPATDDELYDYFLRNFIYSSYPLYEPIVLENPFKLEGIFRLVQGIRKLVVVDTANQLPKGKIHLVVGTADTYVPNAIHERFWDSLPPGLMASRLFIEGSGHKIPELEPQFAANWLKHVIAGDPAIQGGRTFDGTPTLGRATSGSTVVSGLGGR